MTIAADTTAHPTAFWSVDSQRVAIHHGPGGPVTFGGFVDEVGYTQMLRPFPLVEVFTTREQRARTSQSYVRSAIGERLRHVSSTARRVDAASVLEIVQLDATTGIRVTTSITKPDGVAALRFENVVTNEGDDPVILTAVASLVVGIGHTEGDLDQMDVVWGESEWLAEGRWHERPLRDLVPSLSLPIHAQDGRGRFALTSHGAWSTGEAIPVGVVLDGARDSGIAWQIESGTAWQWSIGQTLSGAFLSLTGPADLEHHFAHRLAPGDSFAAAPAAIAFARGRLDDVVAQLTAYRRFLRHPKPVEASLPIVYNDFMNTLMGDPSTEKLLPLIESAADAGVEYFCVDAGWFAGGGDWWDTVGEWVEDPTRFTNGFRSVVDAILARGMRAGTWLEPEVVGVNSPLSASLPEDAFFRRFGERVQEHGRYHLDFRHPAAVAHLDNVVDRLVSEYDISFLKLDYNINPGAGTEWQATAAGDGLLAHSRAFIQWLRSIQRRHPELIIENCSSGAMRMDYAYLAHTHLQSTSDQQDFRRYPVIAASAPMSVAPEQAGNWAYPAAEMSDEETAFTLATGLAGRLYLSGFLHRLRANQRELVNEAVSVSKQWRHRLAGATPFWPLGLPGWDDESLAVGFDCNEERLLAVWSRATRRSEIRIPDLVGTLELVYPLSPGALETWSISQTPMATMFGVPSGPTARVYRISA